MTNNLTIPRLPANTRAYCIGDIHGRVDLLIDLMQRIEHHAQYFSGRVVIIYLGDYIDRGRHSKEVIDFLLHNKKTGVEYVYLRGNHEQVLLNYLWDENLAMSWLFMGGAATMGSYRVAAPDPTNALLDGMAIHKQQRQLRIKTPSTEISKLQHQFRISLPNTHYQFFSETQLCYSLGDYFFVHAGVNVNYSLATQRADDLLWIRDKFIQSKNIFEKVIVHGHTITERVEFLPNRIGIDTGACKSGILTCLVLEDDQQQLIQTSPNASSHP
jgi:serine/threonine protein phosphatase 1